MRRPRHILPYGPSALLLQWEQRIDEAISLGVHVYAAALGEHPAVRECVPAYASLLVVFDPRFLRAYDLREVIYALRPAADRAAGGLLHELPVVYDGDDLAEVAAHCGLSSEEVIRLHTAKTYRVFQLGYQPGFAFLGVTDERLAVGRRAEARRRVPAGAVGLAGRQTGVYPGESPGGWQLIGRCPLPLLHPNTDAPRLRAGDQVRFRAVTAAEFTDLHRNPSPWPER